MADSFQPRPAPLKTAPSLGRDRFRRVVLTGFMGAGKSTVGRLLAAKLGWFFLDVDACIEDTAGTRAEDLFTSLGEAAFRQLEAETLASCLLQSNVIIAPGGAAIDMPRNQQALAASHGALIVFLDAPFGTLIERCLLEERQGRSTYRPLLHNHEVALARYAARRSLYAAHAHLTVTVSDRRPDEIASQILSVIQAGKGLG
jgi:shikimate kinase